ncbi:hypothetical protein SAMN05444920_101707 [Nonomuraea solani]|uniref:PPE family protein n=1 Tax=Nonomuraea solani TaxID=1144553 RepID=A0A1H5UZ21_9ACTN|nr:hypothetical protein [Nonomuraea solani]SEF80339.1 hypothetical protein SAMN05444920_101707 [Nonomuraea solani]
MLEQPESVFQGSTMALTGSLLLGMGRGRRAAMLLPLMAGDTGRQRAAADGWDEVARSLTAHPDLVERSVTNVSWTAPSAELFTGTIRDYADDAGDKAASPKASADVLRTTANVYDVLGQAAFATGAAMLTAGYIYRMAQLNAFTRVPAEVAATSFGIRADQQAGQLASRVRAFAMSGQGIVGKAVAKLAQMSAGKKVVLGGIAGVTGGMMGQSAVAGEFGDTAIKPAAPGVKA